MSGRSVFLLASSIVIAVVLFAAVVRPAVERGGVGELALVVGALAVVLLAERWLRGR